MLDQGVKSVDVFSVDVFHAMPSSKTRRAEQDQRNPTPHSQRDASYSIGFTASSKKLGSIKKPALLIVKMRAAAVNRHKLVRLLQLIEKKLKSSREPGLVYKPFILNINQE